MIDIERRLMRWADWCARRDDFTLGYPRECAYTRLHGSFNLNAGAPGIDYEAWQTEKAVQSLPEIPRLVIIETYMRVGTIRMKCKRLGISYNTLAKYLDQAHADVSAHILKNQLTSV